MIPGTRVVLAQIIVFWELIPSFLGLDYVLCTTARGTGVPTICPTRWELLQYVRVSGITAVVTLVIRTWYISECQDTPSC